MCKTQKKTLLKCKQNETRSIQKGAFFIKNVKKSRKSKKNNQTIKITLPHSEIYLSMENCYSFLG